jgi:23S rRNA (cytidine1920-2'-O)/16S rRNA (cytidine1409-2'-O)-methyltransferase
MSAKPKLQRLDRYLVARKLADSAEAARKLIVDGLVLVNGNKALSAVSQISENASVTVGNPEKQWVSRGAYKLLKAVDYFKLDAKDKVCIDIGASTGGFTDVLLSLGARKVYAVDVGYGQLAWKLRNDPRVVVMERTNARFLTNDMFNNGEKADIIVSDASFISLKLLLPPAQELLSDQGLMAVLVKPQFEVSREEVGHGVVSEPALHEKVIEDMSDFIEQETKLRLLDRTYSPIRGPEGNIEFLFLLALKDREGESNNNMQAVKTLVAEAHAMAAGKTRE